MSIAYDGPQAVKLQKMLATLREENARLKARLAAAERVVDEFMLADDCPDCDGYMRESEHDDQCHLGMALAAWRELSAGSRDMSESYRNANISDTETTDKNTDTCTESKGKAIRKAEDYFNEHKKGAE